VGIDTQPIEPPPPHGLARIVAVFAPVRRDEIAGVVLMTINVFVLLTTYYVLKVLREPLILLGGGAELKAYASAGQTLLLLGVVPVFSWLSKRADRVRLLTIVQLANIGCLFVFYLLAQLQAPIGLAFYLWVGIFNVLVISNFWSFANDIYTPEQGKRLFAIVGFGASLGAIAGAFAPKPLHAVVGLHGLMLVAATGLAISIVIYRIVDAHAAKRPRQKAKEQAVPAESKRGGFQLVLADRYLRILAFMLLVATIINTTGEYVVGRIATEHAAGLPEEARDAYVSDFYSGYYTLVNVASAVLQGLIVARLMTWLGVRKVLFVMPVIVLFGWVGLFFVTNLATVRVEKTTENSLDYSLHNTVRQALFLPTSRDAKYRGKAAIDTFFFRMGDVIAGLGIVFVFVQVLGFGARAFAALNIALAAIWLLLAARAGRIHDELTARKGADDER
jgi:AAA family ATP:ADP antiporter